MSFKGMGELGVKALGFRVKEQILIPKL